MSCPVCNNTKFNKEGLCSYCMWKGNVGPGLELRLMLGTANHQPKSISKEYEKWCDDNRPSTQEQRKAAYAAIWRDKYEKS